MPVDAMVLEAPERLQRREFTRPRTREDDALLREVRLVGALGVQVPSYGAALALLASGRVPFADIDRRIVGFDGLAELLGALATGSPDTQLHSVVVPA
jgi:alcohol dehydrogenase